MLSKIRKHTFWTIDKLTGNRVCYPYEEMKLFDRLDSNNSVIINKQKKQINKLIKHAKSTTEFYGDIKSENLEDFPIINKNLIRNNLDLFLSSKYLKHKLVTISTSGSTGTPFTCYQNIEKKRRVNAEIIYYSSKLGYQVGDRLIFMRSLTKTTNKSAVLKFIQNEKLQDISELNDNKIREMLRNLEDYSRTNSIVLSYASTLDVLKDYFKRNGYDNNCKFKGIISGAEMLYDETRKSMEDAFSCKCVSRYSNQENGVLGQDDEENNVFIINESSYYIEIFDMHKDILAESGTIGRIVITDLYNFAMPMIRYDTGDVGRIDYITKGDIRKKVITDFGGRKIDMIYDSEENPVSPHKISVLFWQFPELQQYQFIQTGKNDYHVKVNSHEKFEKSELLIKGLRDILGYNTKITISPVEEIPVLSSGKRKYILNEYKKNK